ncbi:MAG: T9SS type A sorting domain-containing protein [Candidatus Kapabacteria bacterium]|nr:T9SS type A sorting domain-containing protein [Candidatus Kapabacteria bacterium]
MKISSQRFAIFIALFFLMISTSNAWDFVETFDKHNAPANSYANGSYVGENGITWNYVTGRGDAGFQINGKGLMLRDYPNYNATLFSSSVANGIVNFRCLLKKAFTGAGSRQVELYINGVAIATSTAFDNTQTQVFEVNNINIEGDVVIELRNRGRQIVIDDLSWTTFGKDHGNTPTRIEIVSLAPAVPMMNVPFTAIVQFLDNDGLTNSFDNDTQLELMLRDGSGNLTGTKFVTVPAGQTYYSFKDLVYDKAEQVRIRAHVINNYAPDETYYEIDRIFNVSATPVLMADVYTRGHAGSVHPTMEVFALNSYGSPNVNYDGFNATINVSGGSFSGSATAQFKEGIAKFENIVFDNATTYSVSFTAPHLGNSNNTNVSVIAQPNMTEIIVPRYIKGEGTFLDQGGNGRIPHFALVQVNGLHPNTVYRYVSGWVRDIPNVEELVFTAGRNIHKQYFSNNYTYNSGKFLNNAFESSSLMSDNSGTAKVWMAVVSDNDFDVRYAGNRVNWILGLGSEKGSEVTRLFTNTQSAVLRFSTAQNDFNCDDYYGDGDDEQPEGVKKDSDELQVEVPNDPSCVLYASGIYDAKSPATPMNFVVLYDADDVVVSSAIVQFSGAALITPGFPHQAPWFYADYEQNTGAFATMIPNNLPGGIQKVVEYDAQGNIVNQWTDSDGTWAGYNTASSNWGMNPPREGNSQGQIAFQLPNIQIESPVYYEDICNTGEEFPIQFDARGTSLVDIWIQRDENPWEMIASNVDARNGYYDWYIFREVYTSTENRIRITSVEHGYVLAESSPFRVFDAPIHMGNTESAIYCPEEIVQISVTADGTDMQYQWFKDGVPMKDGVRISGSQTEILTINGVRHHDAAVYTAIVKGNSSCEPVYSGDIAVYIARPLGFIVPMSDQTIGEVMGQKATLSFRAHVNGFERDHPIYQQYDIKVQWYKYVDGLNDLMLVDNNRISGSKSDYLTISDLARTDFDSYYAVITGKCGTSAKTYMFNLIEMDIKFTQEPGAVIVCLGDESVQFSAEATTAQGLDIVYQWLKNGNPIMENDNYKNVNTSTLTILAPTKAHEGNYSLRARISGGDASVISSSASLKVNTVPVITMQPESVTVEEGGGFILEVAAIGNDDSETLVYAWYKDGVLIEDLNISLWLFSDAQIDDNGTYYVTVTNDCGTVKSVEITIEVTPGTTDVQAQMRNGYILNAPVPNPVIGNSEVKFYLPQTNQVKMTLVNEAGQEVAILLNESKSEGTHSLNIDSKALNLVSGTYYITLLTNDVQLSNRMIVIR